MPKSMSRTVALAHCLLLTAGLQAQTISSDVGTTICKGTTVVMTASTQGVWQFRTSTGGSWTDLGSSNIYTTAGIGNGYEYRLRVSRYDDNDNEIISYSDTLSFTVNGEQAGINTITDPSRGSISLSGSHAFSMSPGIAVNAAAYTFDVWFRLNLVPGLKTDAAMYSLIGAGTGVTHALSVIIANANTVRLQCSGHGSVDFTVPKLSTNTWYHLAVVRNAIGEVSVFLNGTRSSSGKMPSSNGITNETQLNKPIQYVGRNRDGLRFNGQISNLRMVTGSALYDPSQSSISVPTTPLTSVSNTSILLLANSSGTIATDESGTQTVTTDPSSSSPGFSANSPFRETITSSRTLSNSVAGGSWSSSNTAVATVNASTGVVTPVANGNADITYSITTGGCTSSDVTPLAVSLPCVTNSWTGGTGNWNVAGNWSCGTVPDGSTDITVASGTPTIDLDVTIPSGKTLTLSGSASLTVAAGRTLTIAGTADFGGRPVTLQSNAGGDAAIAPVTGTLSNASQVTVERYIASDKRAWRLLTIPLSGSRTLRDQWAGTGANANAPTGEAAGSGTLLPGHQLANGTAAAAAGFDWYTGLTASSTSSIRFYTHSGSAGSFSSASNTPDVTTAPARQGYMVFVRGDRTVTTGSGTTTLKPSGTLLTGTRNVSISQAYEVVGNPYAATLDADQVYLNSGNSSVIQRNFWVWDATLGTAGGFRAISHGGSSYAMTGGGGTASDFLKVRSGNAFFVQKNGSGGTLSIEENDKVDGSTAPVVLGPAEAAEAPGILSVRLLDARGLTLDGAALRLGTSYLSLVRHGRYLAIESRPWPATGDTAFLAAWNLPAGDHRLSIHAENIPHTTLSARLLDAFTGRSTPLDLGGEHTEIPFQTTSDTASRSLARFTIVFQGTARVAGTAPANGEPAVRIVPNPSSGRRLGLQLTNLPAGDYHITIRSADGATIAHRKVGVSTQAPLTQVILDDATPLAPGPYLITLDDGKGFRRTLKGWHRN
jgi:hypothetical protein